MPNGIQRFLFEDLDIRGAVIQLDSVWEQLLARRNYPPRIIELLGQMTATTLLLADNLKQPGRLTFQLRGDAASQPAEPAAAEHPRLPAALAEIERVFGGQAKGVDAREVRGLDETRAEHPQRPLTLGNLQCVEPFERQRLREP